MRPGLVIFAMLVNGLAAAFETLFVLQWFENVAGAVGPILVVGTFVAFGLLNMAALNALTRGRILRTEPSAAFDPLEQARQNPPPPPPRPRAWEEGSRPPPYRQPDYQWTSPPPRYQPPPPVHPLAWAYRELGVAPSASRDEVKAAYRRLVLRYHPDRNPNPKSVERFRSVQAAYDALSA